MSEKLYNADVDTMSVLCKQDTEDLYHAGKRIKQYCQKNRGCGYDHPASASHGLSGYGRDGARMDRDGHDGARHYPSDFEPKVVRCFIQGKI